MKSLKINNGLLGDVVIPGDKSISHRSIIIPAISKGVSEITNILMSEDVQNTMNAFELMGVKIKRFKKKIKIYGKGLNSLKKPKSYITNNVIGFFNVLELSKNFDVKRLVYASSSSVYGLNFKYPFSVKGTADHPLTVYGMSKRSNELMAHVYSYLYKLLEILLNILNIII